MNQKRRVLILVAIPNFNYSDEKSAVLSYLNSIKLAFENNGDDVHYLSLNKAVENFNRINENKASNWKAQLKKILKFFPFIYYSAVFFKYFKSQNNLFNLFQDRKPFDLIIEFHTVGSTVGIKLAKLWNASYSVIFDSPTDEQFLEMHGTKTAFWNYIKNAEKMTLEGADKIMVYSPACKEYLEEKYNLKARINITPSLLNKLMKINRSESSTFNIGFIGSFLSWHKIDMLIEAFADFHFEHPDSKLILIGYGQEWAKVKRMIFELKLEQAIELTGFISEEELIEYKNKFSVAVMPGSNWYGSPLKLFEYAQAGIPFIAPVSKTVSSIFIDRKHCLFVKSANEKKSLIEALELYYSDKGLRELYASNAKLYVEKEFNEKKYAERLIESLA